MPNFFFTDANGQKRGPINDHQLRALATRGVITPKTPMETESGHKGVAGQIPGLFPSAPVSPPAPKQLFCTNCGNSVSEQAVACMSCGAKPIGHKKFCRQCGVRLNPEQIVCVKCGMSIVAAPASRTGKGVRQVVQSIMSSPSIEKIKKIPRPVMIAGIAGIVGLVVLLWTFWPNPHPLKKVKPGDWARFDVTMSKDDDTEKATLLLEVMSNDGKKAKLRTTITDSNRYRSSDTQEIEIDLSISPEGIGRSMSMLPRFIENDIKIEAGKTEKETVLIAGRKLNCIVTPSTMTGPTEDGGNFTITAREWNSKDVPAAWLVKMVVHITRITKRETETVALTQTLAAFGHDAQLAKELMPPDRGKLAKVTGKITFSDGTPVSGGKIRFQSDKNVGVGSIAQNGTYSIGETKDGEGIRPGIYKVGILAGGVHPKHYDPNSSGITVDVPARGLKKQNFVVEKEETIPSPVSPPDESQRRDLSVNQIVDNSYHRSRPGKNQDRRRRLCLSTRSKNPCKRSGWTLAVSRTPPKVSMPCSNAPQELIRPSGMVLTSN